MFELAIVAITGFLSGVIITSIIYDVKYRRK